MSSVRRLRRSPRLVAGLLMVAVAAAAAIAGLLVAGDPGRTSEAILVGPSSAHPLGTDELGRDVLSRMLHGAGTSLAAAIASVVPATVVGVALGIVSGYAGRILDDVILKATELFQIIPRFLLALVAGALFGPSFLLLVIILNITFWPFTARLARGETIALREREYVEAARARILFGHILPGVLPVVIVNTSFQAGVAMLIEAGLAFLGLSDANLVSWGQMLSDGQDYLGVAWWVYVFPGGALTFTILGINLVGDGLNQLRGDGITGPRVLDRDRLGARLRRALARSTRRRGALREAGEPAGEHPTVAGRPLLEVRGLTTRFREEGATVTAVEDASFAVAAGRRLGIVGESGSGKTVTAMSIMGLVDEPGRVEAGEIRFEDTELRGLSEREYRAFRGARIAMVFQDPLSSLNPVISVGEQLVESIRLHRRASEKQARRLAIELLGEVGIPRAHERVGAYPHELSGGMRQRVAIALALACDPSLLIADEPTTALDVTIQAQILALLRRLTDERGMATILITHDLAVIAGFAEEVVVMHHGRIVEHADVDTIFSCPTHPYTRSLLASVSRIDRPRRRRSTDARSRGTPASPAASCERIPGQQAVAGQAEILRVTGLTKHFPVTTGRVLRRTVAQVHAVDDVSLVVYEGQTLGLVGESGCGKSTVIRAILRLVAPTGGEVVFAGHDVRRASRGELRALRRDMQIVFQDSFASLNPRFPGGRIISEPLRIHRIPHIRERVGEMLEQVGLVPEHAARRPRAFSGGQRQRIAIARALATHPRLIVCDEPVSALDVSVRGQVLDLLADLQEQLGHSYIFVSHDLSVVRDVADQVAVMYLGRIVELAPTDSLYERPRHPYTVALLSAVPVPDPSIERQRRHVVLGGEPPSPTEPPPACRFHPRCPKAQEVCRTVEPPLVEHAVGHWAACHFPENAAGASRSRR
ncbi:MAG: dipeptide ABC transporter ATP-binding protein [Solirubrobacteraceae bacterium]